MRPPPHLAARLNALAGSPVNYDPDAIDLADPPPGWTVDERWTGLPSEPPGEPVADGSWEVARRLIRGYEFADPSLVRAYYDPDAPLQGRDMLLGLRALGLVTVYAGTRVCVVWDETRRLADDRRARVFGWAYRTLEGHVEKGQMDWQVWKWLDTGEVQFRTHAVSRTAAIPNPVIRLGFHVLKGRERRIYLASTQQRMRTLTATALDGGSEPEAIADASAQLTARRDSGHDELHGRLARRVDDGDT